MKSLYRKYRPLALDDVIGQDQVTLPLKKSLEQGKVGHAYLFVGPRGCGKTSVARIFAHEINGFKYELEDDYVDIIEIDGASNRGIDNIRELREKAAIAPTSGKYKVYIIDEVHMLTKEAFNALLKTLEEPPAHVVFIMATTDAYKVPVTITSRAQTYTFELAPSEVMLKHLQNIAKQEKINIDDDALEVIVKKGGGSFRDSISLLDQISTLSDKKITKDMIVSAMGLPEEEKIQTLIDAYKASDINSIIEIYKSLLSSGIKAETLAEELMTTIVDNPEPEILPLLAKLPDVKAPYAEARLLVALTDQVRVLSDMSFSGPASPSSTSYAGTPAEPSLRDEPVGSVRNIRLSRSNRQLSSKKTLSDTRTDSLHVPEKAPLAREEYSREPVAGFSWESFTAKVQELNDAIYSQLLKVKYEFTGSTLELYPSKKIVKSILSKDNNRRVLVDALGGSVKITIHDVGDTPSNQKTDDTLAKISDIMGGEVQNDGGGNPFE